MKIGIVGNGQDKFTPETEQQAKTLIFWLVYGADIIVSGHSPSGGVDIWAENIAKELGVPTDIKTPKDHSWSGSYGYRARNIDIAQSSDIVHVLVVKEYPSQYTGRRFKKCYHCNSTSHIKSGGCWTAKYALKLGKKAIWHEI